MTSATTYPTQRSQSGGVFVFIILALLALIAYASINVILGKHAMESHPDTAPLTRECIQRNGVWKAYQEPKPYQNTFHWLCQDPVTKTIYDMIVEKIDEFTYREKTAFVRKDGKWTQVDNWLPGKQGGSYVSPPQGPFNLIPPP
jgi:hypothetical protein